MCRLFTLILLISWWQAGAQDPSYTQYTVKDGLAGSTVYHALQDSNGFIWFATNQGVSRFDGKTFRNFSKEDGLPDNEILRLYLDRHNNMWFISLSGIPSVFYKGAFRQIDGCKGVYAISEDLITDSILLFTNYTQDIKDYQGYYGAANRPGEWRFKEQVKPVKEEIYSWPVLKASSEKQINFHFSLADPHTYALVIKSRYHTTRYTFPYHHSMYLPFYKRPLVTLTANRKGVLFYTGDIYLADTARLTPIPSLKELHLKYYDLNALYHENDSTLWMCTRNKGLIRVRNFLSPARSIQLFFSKACCSSILKDREAGYWVTTLNEGVFYLPDPGSHYISGQGKLAAQDVRCIRTLDPQHMVAGFTDGNIFSIDNRTLQGKLFPQWEKNNENNRVLDIRPYTGRQMLVASDYGFYLFAADNSYRNIGHCSSIKGMFLMGDSSIVLASGLGLYMMDPRSKRVKTIFRQRITCVDGIGNRYYWGTFNGMYTFADDSIQYLGARYPALSRIINHIDVAPDSAIWVSTQQGVVVLKNGRITGIGRQQGLLSSMCKHVLLNGHTAWISTDKGISRVAYHWDHDLLIYTVAGITEMDGLIAADVNQTAISGKYIWAATARGICFFPEDYTPHSMQSPLINISTIVSGNKEMTGSDTVAIDYKKNKLLIGLSGISFRSGKYIRYQYRLKDLDSNWTSTANSLLEFSTLPFGIHTFEVRAIDRWGVKSRQTKKLVITVPPPLWKTAWFMLVAYLLVALLAGWGVYAAFRRQHRQRDAAYLLRKKMADLEMMALRAQMNPHFIFNCLSSIQHYILRSDIINANLYLHKFSMLIRKILQYSTASDITLAEELKVLELYLELEKLRLGERMDYSIAVEEGLARTDLYIPSMIIQPHVENAIKHGISALLDKPGMVRIDFRRLGNYLVCTIDDNGIGIHIATQKKQASFPGYRSLGTGITESRINIMNAIQKEKILLEVIDKKQQGFAEQGTVVRLCFPMSNN